jgi:hypothetical protein
LVPAAACVYDPLRQKVAQRITDLMAHIDPAEGDVEPARPLYIA